MAQLWSVLESLDSSILKPFAHKRDEDDQDQELKISRKKRSFSTKKQTWDHPKTLNIALLPRWLKYGVLMELSEGKKVSALVPIPRVGIRSAYAHEGRSAADCALSSTNAGRQTSATVAPLSALPRNCGAPFSILPVILLSLSSCTLVLTCLALEAPFLFVLDLCHHRIILRTKFPSCKITFNAKV